MVERRQIFNGRVINNGPRNRQGVVIPCISRTLFEVPPQSKFIPLQIFYLMVHFYFSFLSKFVYGQFLITIFDYYMVKLEKTLDFCVPQAPSFSQVAENHRKTLPKFDRPVNWFFFIPALIWLRVIRFWLSAWSILLGKGEVTAKDMRMNIVNFRRYYRSIRHYAVASYSPDELETKHDRLASVWPWEIYYFFYEKIRMVEPPVAKHSNMPDDDANEQTDNNSPPLTNGHGGAKKNSLNEIDDVDSSDEDLNTTELLEKYGSAKDTSADPDYIPSSSSSSTVEASSEENSSISDDADTEEERTESQKKLNDEDAPAADGSKNSSPSKENGYSSDVVDSRDKSSPPEKGYSSDTDVFSFNQSPQQKPQNSHQVSEVTSSLTKASSNPSADKVSNQQPETK